MTGSAKDEQTRPAVDLFSLPGHDRDCARAMLNQARLGPGPSGLHAISDVQVQHLLRIGYSAGRQASVTSFAEAIVERPKWRRHLIWFLLGDETVGQRIWRTIRGRGTATGASAAGGSGARP